jgi:F0F1-type ATP synthase assembly protein I
MNQDPIAPFDRKTSRLMAVFGSAGFTIVAATLLGFVVGHWLDNRIKTTPLFMIALLLLGFLAAVVNVYWRVKGKRSD